MTIAHHHVLAVLPSRSMGKVRFLLRQNIETDQWENIGGQNNKIGTFFLDAVTHFAMCQADVLIEKESTYFQNTFETDNSTTRFNVYYTCYWKQGNKINTTKLLTLGEIHDLHSAGSISWLHTSSILTFCVRVKWGWDKIPSGILQNDFPFVIDGKPWSRKH